MRSAPLASWLLSLALAAGLGGCIQVEEDLAFEADGSGTYDLRLVWDHALLRRLVDLVGPQAAEHFRGRDLPLTLSAWKDGLADLDGVTVRHLALEEGEGGLRTLSVQLRFRHLGDLLRWEPFARRGLVVRTVEVEGAPARAELVTTPLARIPFLDPLLAARAARRRAPEPGGGAGAARELDPPPFERLGIPARRADLAETLLGPRLREVRLSFRLRPPGALAAVGAGGEETEHGARFAYDLEALEGGRERTQRLTWEPRPFDPVPAIEHEGDGPSGAVPSR